MLKIAAKSGMDRGYRQREWKKDKGKGDNDFPIGKMEWKKGDLYV